MSELSVRCRFLVFFVFILASPCLIQFKQNLFLILHDRGESGSGFRSLLIQEYLGNDNMSYEKLFPLR